MISIYKLKLVVQYRHSSGSSADRIKNIRKKIWKNCKNTIELEELSWKTDSEIKALYTQSYFCVRIGNWNSKNR